jgi:ElaB/YqjD/DUF883 family membrane-anchored ribosome-binding protein
MKFMKMNIMAGALVASAFLAMGCNRSRSEDTGAGAATQTAQNIQGDLSNAWEKTKETTTNAWDKAKSSVQSTGDYTYSNKDAFLARTKADLDKLDAKIQEWSDKAVNAADSAKADAQARLQDLRAQRGVLDQKYQAVKNSTDANWDQVKAGFENSYDNMTNSMHQAWQWLNDKLGT